MNSEYYAEIHDSVKNVDSQEWGELINSNQDLAMDPRLVYLLENTLSDQAKFWTVVIRNQQRQLISCACLSLFQTDVMQSAVGLAQTLIQRLRRYWPNALKLKVLFCGLPLPSGHTHLRIHHAADSSAVLKLLNDVMIGIARQQHAQLLVFKELNAAQDKEVQYLQQLGYVRGELQPIYQLSRSFKDFAEYKAQLRAPYRHQIQVNVKKFNTSGLQVQHFFEPEEIYSQFSDAVHQLYLNVWDKAPEKLECFSADFFRELPRALPNQVVLTLIKDEQKAVAFAIGVVDENNYYNLYVGLDYLYLQKTDLYFNLFFHELDQVFGLNKTKILLGQTSGMFKARLGASPDPRFFWVRPLNPILRMIFKYFQKLIFPQVKIIKENQVFKD